MKKKTQKEFVNVENENIKMEKIGEDTYKVTSKLTKDNVEVWLKDFINKMDLKPHINFNTTTHMIEINLDFTQDICYNTGEQMLMKAKNPDNTGLKYNYNI